MLKNSFVFLSSQQIRSWRHVINLACFTRASTRNVTITRSTRDDVLNFDIHGGSDTLANNGIFVSIVERTSKAYEAGLRRGDQVNYETKNFWKMITDMSIMNESRLKLSYFLHFSMLQASVQSRYSLLSEKILSE